MENFQKVIISNQPASIWVISPPAREQLVAKVQDSLQAHSSLNLHGSWTISRYMYVVCAARTYGKWHNFHVHKYDLTAQVSAND